MYQDLVGTWKNYCLRDDFEGPSPTPTPLNPPSFYYTLISLIDSNNFLEEWLVTEKEWLGVG